MKEDIILKKLVFKKRVSQEKTKTLKIKKKLSQVKKSKTYVLIDASYFIFRRYCATQVWYSRHTDKGSKDDCHIENDEFVKYYTKHFGDWIENIRRQYRPDQIFWFQDAPKNTVWRTPLFKTYKGHRDDLCPPHVGKFFEYSYESLIPKDKLIFVARTEADDSLAISARYENKYYPENEIIIFTGDSDYLQLVNQNTKVVNMKGKKCFETPVEVVTGTVNKKKIKRSVSGSQYLMVKIILGDKTDGIPGIPGCGPSTAYKLSEDDEFFEKYINGNVKRKEIYEKNRMLISFDEIPDDLKKEIEETYFKVKNVEVD